MERIFHYGWIALWALIRLALLIPLYLITSILTGAAILIGELCDGLDVLTARIQERGTHDPSRSRDRR